MKNNLSEAQVSGHQTPKLLRVIPLSSLDRFPWSDCILRGLSSILFRLPVVS